MRKLFTLPLLAMLALTSCANMGEMTPVEFDNLKNRVSVATTIVSSRLAQDWNQEKRDQAIELVAASRAMVETNNLATLDASNVLRSLVEQYGNSLGLDDQGKRDLRDASLLVELVVGPIDLGIEGKLDPRDQELILAFLEGLELGLS